ncbi:glycosyltransferase family 2 protein [Pseudactinotalea sp. Z1748]|uniref:glycosyltransferase family 2 protein n=1 Tax=Pseudactinotalea sp. Z1748 TaxID=3413027 RepID=UPI003C79D48D
MIDYPVVGQQWRDLPIPALSAWVPELSVCVVLPARDCQQELNLTLAALRQQSYPEDLFEVIVVDDASTPELDLPPIAPRQTRIIRVGDMQAHGSGRARDRGARSTEADVLLFLDADMVPDRWHVEAHARWHHLTPHAVVIGRKWFVDFQGVSADDVSHAVADDALETLLEGRSRQKHGWVEHVIKRNKALTNDADETFIAVVGADVSISKQLYMRCGGFQPFGLRGIVDTEFGYRAFTSGGLIIPDREAIAYHQGARSFASSGQTIKRERLGLAANYLPLPMFRPNNSGRQWRIPTVQAIVSTEGSASEDVLLTVDTLLSSTFTDLNVAIVGEVPSWLRDYYANDQRVTLEAEVSVSGFPAPVTLAISPGVQVGPNTIASALERLRQGTPLYAQIAPGVSFTMRTTRSIERSAFPQARNIPLEPAEVNAADLGVTRTEHHVNPQGLIVLGPAPPSPEPAKKKKLSVPARARRKARHIRRRITRGVRRVFNVRPS